MDEPDDNLVGSELEQNLQNPCPPTKPYSIIIDELMDSTSLKQ